MRSSRRPRRKSKDLSRIRGRSELGSVESHCGWRFGTGFGGFGSNGEAGMG
ncbi:unnamed protein product [Malus baccata var. baccata]